MMINKFLALLVLSVLASEITPTPAIQVCIIDEKTGRPMARREVLISPIDMNTHMLSSKPGMTIKGFTDNAGKASFSLETLNLMRSESQTEGRSAGASTEKKRLTDPFDFQVTYASGGIQCSSGLFSLDEVVSAGMVGDDRCGKGLSDKPLAKPNEIVIFVGKYRWWEAGQS